MPTAEQSRPPAVLANETFNAGQIVRATGVDRFVTPGPLSVDAAGNMTGLASLILGGKTILELINATGGVAWVQVKNARHELDPIPIIISAGAADDIDLILAAKGVSGRVRMYSSVDFYAIGEPPFTVACTDLVASLNADMVDGLHAAAFALVAHEHDATQVAYTPAELTDWGGDADPGAVADALDQLAGRSSTAVPFITDVTDADGTPDVTYEAGTVPADAVVESVEYQDGETTVTIHGEVDGGPGSYTPVVTIEGAVSGSPVAVTELVLGTNTRRYQFATDVTLTGEGPVYCRTADGGEHSIEFALAAAPPEITTFTHGDPPGSQTRVKNGDSVSFSATFPAGAVKFIIENWGLHGTTATEYVIADDATSIDDTVTIAGTDSDDDENPHTLKAHLQMASEANGNTKESTSTGLYHDSAVPTVGSVSVDYATRNPGQSAIKDSEICDVTCTVTGTQGDTGAATDWSTIAYSDNSTGELTIPSATTYAAEKAVTRLSGDYRETGTNYRVVVSKSYNDTSTTKDGTVRIAHTTPVVRVDRVSYGSQARMGSDDGTNNYKDSYVYLRSDQVYGAAPDATDGLVAPVGAWQGSWASHNTTTYRRYLRIADGDIVIGGQGSNTPSWTSCEVKNRALRAAASVTTYPTYTVGGFAKRRLTIPAWPNREADIGCLVVATGSLVAEQLSKGGDGPGGGTIQTFSNAPGEGNTPTDTVDYFCISDGGDLVDSDGRFYYNKDLPNAESNTTGTAQVDIEEAA